MTQITTFLMFEGDAEAAIDFYVSLFPDSEVVSLTRHGAEAGEAAGKVYQAVFTLAGKRYMAIDSPAKHEFGFTPAISLFVTCETEDELDDLFEKLSDLGQVLMPPGEYPFSKRYAWVTDRFGVSWQLDITKR